jgi:hypothetical protein
MAAFASESWYIYLQPKQQTLVGLAYYLADREEQLESRLDDYSFVVFPMSKAYEGFIKKYLLDLGLIDNRTYEGKRFRIGRALNPDISERHRDEFWLFEGIARECGRATAQKLWDVWLLCRNRVFHYYPKENNTLTLDQAQSYLTELGEAMSEAVACLEQTHQGRKRHGSGNTSEVSRKELYVS